MAAAPATTVFFLDDGAASPVSAQVGPALADSLKRAAVLRLNSDGFVLSFDSLLIGLLAADGSTGDWLRARFASEGDVDKLLGRRGLTREALQYLQRHPDGSRLEAALASPLKRTASARQALDAAASLARPEAPDAQHLLRAMLTLPEYHLSDFTALRIDRAAWAAALTSGAKTETPAGFDPAGTQVQVHVQQALRVAAALAASQPVGPAHVVSAILSLAPGSPSRAFERLARLLPQDTKPSPPPTGASAWPSAYDDELLAHLQRVQRPKAGSTEPSPVWGRDLVTAVLLCDSAKLQPALPDGSPDLTTLRERWYRFVTADAARRDVAGWAAWWREAGVPLPGPRRAGYAVETDRGEDKLGVDQEALAFARLIMDKDVHPPLSVGLLGDWGSGKSFFIEQIKKGIAGLKTLDRPELHARVVEIEFNAWHASDANLWASLVTTIFDEIWKAVRPASRAGTVAAAQAQLQKKIEQAEGAMHEAEAQVQQGRDALEQAERALGKKRELLAWNLYVKSVSTQTLKRLADNAGWHQPIQTINEVEQAARTLATSANRLRTVASVLLEKPLLRLAAPTLALLALTLGLWLLVDASALQAWEAKLTKALATLAGLVGTLAAPLHIARRHLDALSGGLEKVRDDYEKTLQEKSVAEASRAEAETVQRARRELESAQASVAAARSRLAELMNQQATLDPRRRLGAFLQERVQSTQYRSQQGIISLVHKDFSELSRYMQDLRETAAATPAAAADPEALQPFDRIVLYVDDLDRCRPAQVVAMLEAVHLLLALDLFVVVVAVDSRWLTRSLEVHYRDLLFSDTTREDGVRESTPQSYLEKIFQVTYALAPMDPTHFREYVDFLAGDPREAAAAPAAPPAPQPPPSAGGSTVQAGAPAPAAPAPAAGGAAPAPAAPTPPPRPPQPTPAVRIGETERKFITSLVPLLPTPRIAKRLVNVYRVIKAGMTAEDLETFEQEGRTRSCLLMLAVLFGRPSIATDLLRSLHEGQAPFDKPDELFVAALLRRSAPADEPATHQAAWQQLPKTLQAIGIHETVGQCAREPHLVARYSLVSGHEWHTWRARPGKD